MVKPTIVSQEFLDKAFESYKQRREMENLVWGVAVSPLTPLAYSNTIKQSRYGSLTYCTQANGWAIRYGDCTEYWQGYFLKFIVGNPAINKIRLYVWQEKATRLEVEYHNGSTKIYQTKESTHE